MNNELLNEIKRIFPNEYANDNNYQVAERDLYVLFSLIDKYVFKNEFSSNKIIMHIVNAQTASDLSWKGKFFISENGDDLAINICIMKYDVDRFSHIISVLCHEMIHVFDFKKSMLGQMFTKYGKIEVTRIGGKKFVHGYDVHGTFFKSFIPKFNNYGIIVNDTYSVKSKNLMKKIKESKRNGNDVIAEILFGKKININETDIGKSTKRKRQLDAYVKSLKNCNAELIYIDDTHWAIGIE